MRTGQIGTPVAARVVACLTSDAELQERLAARALAAATSWLDGELQQVTAYGGPQHRQISALARFRQGQSALVSVGCCAPGRPVLAVVVWGNRGILYWQTDDDLALTDGANEPALSAQEEEALLQLATALAVQTSPQAVHTGRSPAAPIRQETARPPWGVLLVAGDHTHQPGYAEALAADPRCRLVGLTDEADIPERRRLLNDRLAQRLGIPVLDNLQQALRRDDVQIVSICAEPARRGPIIVQAAEAGKHLFLDKPLAGSLEHATRITAAVRQAGVVSHMWSLARTPYDRRIGNLIQSGRLGELAAIHADLCFAKGHAGTALLGTPRQESAAPTRYELPDSKRELTNVGVYSLVSLLRLTGRNVRRLCASTGNYFFREYQTNDMEDFGQILMEMDDGSSATISAGRTGWRSHPATGLQRTVLVGAQETATVDAHSPRVDVWADADPWQPPERDPEDPQAMWGGPQEARFTAAPKQAWHTPPAPAGAEAGGAGDAAYFLDCIENGVSSDVSVDLAAAATQILLAAYRSAATGESVDLPLD